MQYENVLAGEEPPSVWAAPSPRLESQEQKERMEVSTSIHLSLHLDYGHCDALVPPPCHCASPPQWTMLSCFIPNKPSFSKLSLFRQFFTETGKVTDKVTSWTASLTSDSEASAFSPSLHLQAPWRCCCFLKLQCRTKHIKTHWEGSLRTELGLH